jgi:hypothetical protein
MISRKLMHDVLNKLQAVQGFMELGVIEEERSKRLVLFKKAQAEISGITALLKERVRDKADKIAQQKKKP